MFYHVALFYSFLEPWGKMYRPGARTDPSPPACREAAVPSDVPHPPWIWISGPLDISRQEVATSASAAPPASPVWVSRSYILKQQIFFSSHSSAGQVSMFFRTCQCMRAIDHLRTNDGISFPALLSSMGL